MDGLREAVKKLEKEIQQLKLKEVNIYISILCDLPTASLLSFDCMLQIVFVLTLGRGGKSEAGASRGSLQGKDST